MHQPKDIHWLSRWKHVYICTSTYHITLLDPQIICNYFTLLVNHVLLGLAIVIIFYFLLAIDSENSYTSFTIVIR